MVNVLSYDSTDNWHEFRVGSLRSRGRLPKSQLDSSTSVCKIEI